METPATLRARIDDLEAADCEDREVLADLKSRMDHRLDELAVLYRQYFSSVTSLSELATMTSNDLAWHRLSALGHEAAPAITRIAAPGGSRLAAVVTVTTPLSEPDARAVIDFMKRLSRAFGSRPLRAITGSGVFTADVHAHTTDRNGDEMPLIEVLRHTPKTVAA